MSPERAILERAVDWWLREGKHQFIGAPEWVFAAREVIKSKGRPQTCTRIDGHDGPCNGYPRAECGGAK